MKEKMQTAALVVIVIGLLILGSFAYEIHMHNIARACSGEVEMECHPFASPPTVKLPKKRLEKTDPLTGVKYTIVTIEGKQWLATKVDKGWYLSGPLNVLTIEPEPEKVE